MLWTNSALPSASRIAAGDVLICFTTMAVHQGVPIPAPTRFRCPGWSSPEERQIRLRLLLSEPPRQRLSIVNCYRQSRRTLQVIPAGTHVVSYFCDGTQLTRHTRVLTSAWTRPATCAAMVSGTASAVLATNLGVCSLVYDPPGVSTGLSRFGIVSMTLGVSDASGESVNIYHQVHVDNTP